MVFSPKSNTTIWTHALGAELFDRYTVFLDAVPLPNADTLETDVNIQRFST